MTMTMLLDPDVGEVLDRQSILRLKIEMGMNKGVPTEAWEQENSDLDAYLAKKMQSWQRTATSFSVDDFGKLTGELGQCNIQLWRDEDALRLLMGEVSFSPLPEPTSEQALKIAFFALRIANVNDRRSELIRQINGLFGVECQGKIYAK
jgi:hypothetical protein